MKIIDRNNPINLIGGIYTNNNPDNGDEMIVKVVGILEHKALHKDCIENYFILDVLTSTAGLHLNSLDYYISGAYYRNSLLNFNGSIHNKYAIEYCGKFLDNYTKKHNLK